MIGIFFGQLPDFPNGYSSSSSSSFNTTFVLGLGVAINRCVHLDLVRFNLGSESSFTTGVRAVF